MVLIALLWTALASVVPLSDVHFDVAVSGPLADVRITQTFENPTDTTLEAVYLFPLHEDAVVDDMVMRLDDRTIEGRIEEIEEAKKQYEAAIAAGQTAALTESVRWNLFRQTVGNIPPGAEIEVSLRIIQPVPQINGTYELVLPLVAGARFVPPGMSEDEAMSAPYGGGSVRAHVHVQVDGGVTLRDFRVPSHDAFVAPTGDGWEAHAADLPMTRDFVANWTTRTSQSQVGALYDGEHLLLVFEPPLTADYAARRKRRITFVVDRSGSMGASWTLAQYAVREAVASMNDADRIGVITFSNQVVNHGEYPATSQNRDWAQRVVYDAQPVGGTHLKEAVNAALALPPDPERQHYVVVISDGLVGNESEILADLAAYEGDSKVYALGLGAAVNRFVLGELASQGGGVALHVRGSEGVGPMRELMAALDRPTMSEVEVDWGDWGAMDMSPARITDVHLGHPVQVLVRTKYEEGGPIVVRGRIGEEPVEIRVQPRRVQRGRAIASTWARQRIEALGRRQIREGIPARDEGLPLALQYEILSPWTAFIAIDPRKRQVQTRSVDVPVGGDDGRAAFLPPMEPEEPMLFPEPEPIPDDFKGRRYGMADEMIREKREPPRSPPAKAPKSRDTVSYDFDRAYQSDDEFDVHYGEADAPGADSVEMFRSVSTVAGVSVSESEKTLSLDDAFATLEGITGSVEGLLDAGGRFAFSAPIARERWAVGGRTALGTTTIEGGQWRSVPVGLKSVASLGYDGRFTVEGRGIWQSLDGPTFDTLDANRFQVGAGATLEAEGAEIAVRYDQNRFDCVQCTSARRTVAQASSEGAFGPYESRGTIGMRVARTRFESVDSRGATDAAVYAGYTLHERGYLNVQGRFDALWVDDALRPLPSGRVEVGPGGWNSHAALGAARVVDTTVPELALPITTEGYATLATGDAGSDYPRASLKVGWQRIGGPVAPDIRRSQTLSDAEWQRDAVITEIAIRTPSRERGELGLETAVNAVLNTSADLLAPMAPWSPGLLVAHRPFRTELDARLSVGRSRALTDFVIDGAVASPLPGGRDADRWWAGWQTAGRLGVLQNVAYGRVAFGVLGSVRNGRPTDIDLNRVEGWFAPERLRNVGLYGTLRLKL